MSRKPRALVTGGAGFIGSHLCERLVSEGYRVFCLDNLITGSPENVAHLLDRDFEFIEQDAIRLINLSEKMDEVYHLASPASPADFSRLPLEILEAGSLGTKNALVLAQAAGARFLLASTSEVYGDPLVHPQPEDYRGNVNQLGVRGVYDEAKRYAEALTMTYHRHHALDTRIARIFNTYGPRMRPDDGRVIPNFIQQALAGKPLSIYGEGTQTRSFQYVDDLTCGLIRLMKSGESHPVNLGNPQELAVREIAGIIIKLSGSKSDIIYEPLPEDDPRRRCPEISRAREVLGWEPRVPVEVGIKHTIEWFARRASLTGTRKDTGGRKKPHEDSRE